MILTSYKLEIFNSECMPGAMGVHCFAHLDQDVSVALPYLNTELGGFEYLNDPPSVTFKAHGKLITVHGRKIAVNALRDVVEAKKIIEWLKREINAVWENRHNITPRRTGMPRPQLMAILKLLPRTNCGACGDATCLVFATRLAEGVRDAAQCTALSAEGERALASYLAAFTSATGEPLW